MTTTLLIPDDRPVTLTWHTTTVEEHCLTLTYGELREAITRKRDRDGRPHHPDLTGDLDLLEYSWLGDYEDDGSISEFTRTLDGHDLPPVPQLPVFTVSLDDSDDERECPHTYVLCAADLETATTLAITYYKDTYPAEYPDPDSAPDVLTGTWWTFPGEPAWPRQMSGREWTDLRSDEQLLERAYRTAAAS
jgi:hypothetical protein